MRMILANRTEKLPLAIKFHPSPWIDQIGSLDDKAVSSAPKNYCCIQPSMTANYRHAPLNRPV